MKLMDYFLFFLALVLLFWSIALMKAEKKLNERIDELENRIEELQQPEQIKCPYDASLIRRMA